MTKAIPRHDPPVTIPASEYARRRERLAKAAAEEGMAGVLIWSVGGGSYDRFADVFYLNEPLRAVPVPA